MEPVSFLRTAVTHELLTLDGVHFFAGVGGNDGALLNMVMHVHGAHRPSNTLSGSSAKVPNAEDYPPEGFIAVRDVDSCFFHITIFYLCIVYQQLLCQLFCKF